MPGVNTSLLNRIIQTFDPQQGKDIVVPVYEDKRGNPVLWPRQLFAELCSLTGDVGGRHLINKLSERVCHCEAPDDSIHRDIDTPDQLDLRDNNET